MSGDQAVRPSAEAVAPARSLSDAERLTRVEAIPRRGNARDLARAVERFRRRMAEAPLEVDWETLLAAEAGRV